MLVLFLLLSRSGSVLDSVELVLPYWELGLLRGCASVSLLGLPNLFFSGGSFLMPSCSSSMSVDAEAIYHLECSVDFDLELLLLAMSLSNLLEM